MKIAFVQEELYSYMGFMYMSAVAKNMGHEVEVFISGETETFVQEIADYKPDIIGFSATTPNYSFTRQTAKVLTQMLPDSFILVGGWHPTFSPEMLETETCFDAICMGEGEVPFQIFLDSFPDMERVKKVPNFHVKLGDKIFRNPMVQLETDLDKVSFPDRSIYYDKFPILRDQLTKTFVAGRGCAYPCTYCFNENMKRAYKGKGKFVRFRSPENICEEINEVRKKYPSTKYVHFTDDTINGDKKWLAKFCDYYEKEVGLPWIANGRIERLDDNLVQKLKQSGMDKFTFSIEQGNEEFRTKLLKRMMTNEEIFEGSRLLRKYDIRFQVGNILGLPGESFDLALETLKINQQIKGTNSIASIFQPYPGTDLYHLAREEGYLADDFKPENLTGHGSWGRKHKKVGSVIKLENKNKFINLRSFFNFLVLHPWALPIVKPFLSMPPNKFFELFTSWYDLKLRLTYSANTREKINYILQFTQNLFPAPLQNLLEKRFNYQIAN